jgi:hypothetical protein
MTTVAAQSLEQMLALAEELLAGRDRMHEPQDLPGRYGRVIKAMDRLLELSGAEAVLAGGWAVWHHGYVARVTQDVDIVLAADRVEELLRIASVAGFDVLPRRPGRWPKVVHKETGVRVDIMPEGERPGTIDAPAPTTLPHPSKLGARGHALRYIDLPSLVELKLAAGRTQDENDVAHLIAANPNEAEGISAHLTGVHQSYADAFEKLVARSKQQQDER